VLFRVRGCRGDRRAARFGELLWGDAQWDNKRCWVMRCVGPGERVCVGEGSGGHGDSGQVWEREASGSRLAGNRHRLVGARAGRRDCAHGHGHGCARLARWGRGEAPSSGPPLRDLSTACPSVCPRFTHSAVWLSETDETLVEGEEGAQIMTLSPQPHHPTSTLVIQKYINFSCRTLG